jgi:hypothetical protein
MYVVALGAAAIALWVDARLAARAPRTVMWTFVHLGGALLALQLMPDLISMVVGGSDDPARKIAATFLVALPALTYCWLAAIWLLKLIPRTAQPRS